MIWLVNAADCLLVIEVYEGTAHHLPVSASLCSLRICAGKCWLTLVFAAQKLLSECQSHRDCQLPVHHLLFGKDPCPGTSKYLHVDYKCKPSEFSSSPLIRPVLVTPFPNPNPSLSHCHHPLHLFILFVFFPPLTQLNTKDMWCVREGRWSCAVSPPGCWTSMQLSMGEVWAKLTPALHTWQDHPHLVSQRDIQYSHMVALTDNGLQRIYVLYVYII